MWIGFITLFPDVIRAVDIGMVRRAQEKKKLTLAVYNPRDYTSDKHQQVDDRPFGGGPGMVMQTTPLRAAINAAKEAAPATPKVIYLSPQGRPFTQRAAKQLALAPALTLIAGRYEGIDQRVIDDNVDEEWSIGDYVLSGGELAGLVMIDSIARLLPGVLGHEQSAECDSFSEGLLDCPHYTRPDELGVPPVLLSGNHAAIARWRRKHMLGQTWLKRPDLLGQRRLDANELALLYEFMQEYKGGKS